MAWEELKTQGLNSGSTYSNSMGMFRREFWKRMHFDEPLETAEDYTWAVAQIESGHVSPLGTALPIPPQNSQ